MTKIDSFLLVVGILAMGYAAVQYFKLKLIPYQMVGCAVWLGIIALSGQSTQYPILKVIGMIVSIFILVDITFLIFRRQAQSFVINKNTMYVDEILNRMIESVKNIPDDENYMDNLQNIIRLIGKAVKTDDEKTSKHILVSFELAGTAYNQGSIPTCRLIIIDLLQSIQQLGTPVEKLPSTVEKE